MSNTFYQPLLNSIKLLVIDDESYQRDMCFKIIKEHQLYDVETASSSDEAERLLKSTSQPCICLMDLGVDDRNNDEFYLLKKYGQKLPFIIISAGKDITRGFMARDLGAMHLFPKPVDFFQLNFWRILSESFLSRGILPSLPDNPSPVLAELCRAISCEKPDTVSQWANSVGITEAYLRRIWAESDLGSPKHTLFLYNFYSQALHYYDALFLSDSDEGYAVPGKPHVDDHRRKVRYYERYRYELDAILQKGMPRRRFDNGGDVIIADVYRRRQSAAAPVSGK